MHFLNYTLGIQSNIIVAASYNHGLTKQAVYPALRTVVTTHPGLARVAEMAPSKKGRHILQRMLLHTVNLDSCVEFIEQESLEIDAQFIENVHNKEWNWTTVEPGRPWWKLIVVNGRHAVFVFHHMICDGAFASMFHRDLLAALNALPDDQENAEPDPIIRLDPNTVKLPTDPQHLTNTKPSILRAICNALFTLFVHYFLAKRGLFSDIPRPKPFGTSLHAVPDPEQRTVSRVNQLRIPADKMALILAACRAHQTTFTPLLIVLTVMVLAADHYPKATSSFTRTAVDMRPVLRPSPDGTTLMDASAGMYSLQRMRAYRTALARGDPALVWQLVRAYGADLRRGLAQTSNLQSGSAAQPDWQSGNLLSAELEDVLSQAFPALGIAMNNSFMVSNIGACAGGESRWRIDAMQFSAAAVNRNFGCELVYDVAGVKGRDTVVNAVYTDGTFTRERIESILSAVMSRMDALCQKQ
jgi:hypothetical protein